MENERNRVGNERSGWTFSTPTAPPPAPVPPLAAPSLHLPVVLVDSFDPSDPLDALNLPVHAQPLYDLVLTAHRLLEKDCNDAPV